MKKILRSLGRFAVRGFYSAVLLCASMAVLAQPESKAGRTRNWLADEYVSEAQFNLQFGQIVVWKLVGEVASGHLVEFTGVLDDESTRVLGILLTEGRMTTLSMSGPGGLVAPTLKLGRALRTKGVTTVVEAGKKCYSACALLFLAGRARIFNDEPLGFPSVFAEVGFHAPYIMSKDGYARHLQDVKTSSSCDYIKQLLPQQAAAELCAYTLATKGIATFSLEAGKRLHIYTSSEAEELKRIAGSLLNELSLDEQHWIECKRARLHGESDKQWTDRRTKYGSDSPPFQIVPCAAWNAPPVSKSPIRRAVLSKAARALGPRKPTMAMYEQAERDGLALLMQSGLTAGEQHHLDCIRARAWLREKNKIPTEWNPADYSPEFRIWQRACHVSTLLVKPRNLNGIGQLSANEMHILLTTLAMNEGPSWPPPHPQ
jgi:hypothetical protein